MFVSNVAWFNISSNSKLENGSCYSNAPSVLLLFKFLFNKFTSFDNAPHLLKLKLHVLIFHQLYDKEGFIHNAFVNASSSVCFVVIF